MIAPAADQTLLPLLQEAPRFGRPRPDDEALRQRAGVEYFALPTREILNRCDSERMPFAWTINPYRGCEFACTYCYARYTHGFLELGDWRDFETKIFVKEKARAALEHRLRKASLHGQPIAIGTATDPYQPAERHHGVTRSLLEAFATVEGLQISITTKSPLILRDLDLLTELDQRHSITVHVTITTLDSKVARRLEPHAPDPQARLRTLQTLAGEGLDTVLYCMPILPGINDSEKTLRPLFEAARDAGVRDVGATALFLRPAARARFWPWLKEEFPRLVPRYERIYGRRDYPGQAETQDLLRNYRRLKLEFGFPRATVGRG